MAFFFPSSFFFLTALVPSKKTKAEAQKAQNKYRWDIESHQATRKPPTPSHPPSPFEESNPRSNFNDTAKVALYALKRCPPLPPRGSFLLLLTVSPSPARSPVPHAPHHSNPSFPVVYPNRPVPCVQGKYIATYISRRKKLNETATIPLSRLSTAGQGGSD